MVWLGEPQSPQGTMRLPSPQGWSLRYCRVSSTQNRASVPQRTDRVIVRSAHDSARGARTGWFSHQAW